ncbi:MAG: glucose-1-phosphate cytidylyltransferase [Proteobacteria bacterium]|nr:MAG: glucose-1-phosphate cytidylyltransferase [Pseudomonadota bacterium]
MKAVILAGGRGTRIAEESVVRPKPMITIGGEPILLHIMKIYARYGITEFIICLGYRGYMIKEYFANFLLHSAAVVEFDLKRQAANFGHVTSCPWKVTLVETGGETQTGGRIKRIREWVERDDAFCLTYGDGVADIDIDALIGHHRKHGVHATVTTVTPPGRFGAIKLDHGKVTRFVEKPEADSQVINGGFFVLSPPIFDYIAGDDTVWEHEPLQRLAAEGQLSAFQHRGFWQPMDTMRERELLEELWASGKAPWLAPPR